MAIRPTVYLRGTLLVDGDGLYRFAWDKIDNTQPGIWLFDLDGQPLVSADNTNVVYPCHDAAMYSQFPEATTTEVKRVLRAADLVVAVERSGDDDVFDAGGGAVTMSVTQVVHGEGATAGQNITFTPAPSGRPVGSGAVSIWALQLVNGRWIPVSTWLPAGWELREMITKIIAEVFPDAPDMSPI